jgi:hypothetical protein
MYAGFPVAASSFTVSARWSFAAPRTNRGGAGQNTSARWLVTALCEVGHLDARRPAARAAQMADRSRHLLVAGHTVWHPAWSRQLGRRRRRVCVAASVCRRTVRASRAGLIRLINANRVTGKGCICRGVTGPATWVGEILHHPALAFPTSHLPLLADTLCNHSKPGT